MVPGQVTIKSKSGNKEWFNICLYNDINSNIINRSLISQSINYQVDNNPWETFFVPYNSYLTRKVVYGYQVTLSNYEQSIDQNNFAYNEVDNNYGKFSISGNEKYDIFGDIFMDNLTGIEINELDDMTAQELLTEIESLRDEILNIKNSLNSYINVNTINLYATKEYIDSQHYLTEHQSLAGYITQDVLSSNSYITQNSLSNNSYITQQSLSANSYLTTNTLNNCGYITINDVPIVDLSSYVTKDVLSNCGYITINDVPTVDLSSYVTKDVLSNCGYITADDVVGNDVNLSDYVTKDNLSQCGYITANDIPQITMPDINLSDYVTQDTLSECGYITANDVQQIQMPDINLSDYITQDILSECGYITIHDIPEREMDLSDFITQEELSNNSYLTEHQNTSNFATKNYVDEQINNLKLQTEQNNIEFEELNGDIYISTSTPIISSAPKLSKSKINLQDNSIGSDIIDIITDENIQDYQLKLYKDPDYTTITSSDQYACELLVILGYDYPNQLNVILNNWYSNAKIGSRVFIRSHLVEPILYPNNSTKWANTFNGGTRVTYYSGTTQYPINEDYDTLQEIIDNIRTQYVLGDSGPVYNIYSVTKITDYAWTSPIWMGHVNQSIWDSDNSNYVLKLNNYTNFGLNGKPLNYNSQNGSSQINIYIESYKVETIYDTDNNITGQNKIAIDIDIDEENTSDAFYDYSIEYQSDQIYKIITYIKDINEVNSIDKNGNIKITFNQIEDDEIVHSKTIKLQYGFEWILQCNYSIDRFIPSDCEEYEGYEDYDMYHKFYVLSNNGVLDGGSANFISENTIPDPFNNNINVYISPANEIQEVIINIDSYFIKKEYFNLNGYKPNGKYIDIVPRLINNWHGEIGENQKIIPECTTIFKYNATKEDMLTINNRNIIGWTYLTDDDIINEKENDKLKFKPYHKEEGSQSNGHYIKLMLNPINCYPHAIKEEVNDSIYDLHNNYWKLPIPISVIWSNSQIADNIEYMDNGINDSNLQYSSSNSLNTNYIEDKIIYLEYGEYVFNILEDTPNDPILVYYNDEDKTSCICTIENYIPDEDKCIINKTGQSTANYTVKLEDITDLDNPILIYKIFGGNVDPRNGNSYYDEFGNEQVGDPTDFQWSDLYINKDNKYEFIDSIYISSGNYPEPKYGVITWNGVDTIYPNNFSRYKLTNDFTTTQDGKEVKFIEGYVIGYYNNKWYTLWKPGQNSGIDNLYIKFKYKPSGIIPVRLTLLNHFGKKIIKEFNLPHHI